MPESEITIHIDPQADAAFKFAELLPVELKGKLINGRMINIARTRQTLERKTCQAVLANGARNIHRKK